MAFRWRFRNWADTSDPGDPPPVELALPPAEALTRLQIVIQLLPRWKVESVDTAAGLIRATRRTRLCGFIDAVTIRLEALVHDTPRTRVHVRSKSRIGFDDFGENRRNILELFAALERERSS
jgi:uncharacterized protein (DUF1499 family)